MELEKIARRIASQKRLSVTVGEFKEAIDIMKKIEKGDAAKDLLNRTSKAGTKLVIKSLLGLVPGGSIIEAVTEFTSEMTGKDPLSKLFESYGNIDDSKSSQNKLLGIVDLNDDYVEVVDQKLLDDFMTKLKEQVSGLSDDVEIPKTDDLFEQYISEKYPSMILVQVEAEK